MLQLMTLVGLFSASFAAAPGRVIYSLDAAWKFNLKGQAPSTPCPPHSFTIPLIDKQTYGLAETAANTIDECVTQCCSSSTCETYQFCNTSACGSGPPQQPSCWIGRYTGAQTVDSNGWVGAAGRTLPPSPVPTPGTGCNEAWCSPTLDDSDWRSLQLPHDFVVEGNFSEEGDMSHGYLPYGVGYYRKHLTLTSEAVAALQAGTHSAVLLFEGAQTQSTVYLDGQLLGSHDYGYTPFSFVLNSSKLSAGQTLVLAVAVDATKPDGWWYDGGGLYRHVQLALVPKVHLSLQGGVYAPASVTGEIDHAQHTADSAVALVFNVTSFSIKAVNVIITATVKDAKGTVVGSSKVQGSAAAMTYTTLTAAAVKIKSAQLWGPGYPSLYTVETTMTSALASETTTVTIGVRKCTWDANKGFFLNDLPIKLKGTANHQDFAGVGVAVPDALQYHRVMKLQTMGSNAWRTAHNPPNPALLDATDRLGMLVWDENHRNGFDQYSDELERLVLRDRNHPSVVIWSICNEKLCNTNDDIANAVQMNHLFHALDPQGQRVVSANQNAWLVSNSPLDLLGIDYSTSSYDDHHKSLPNFPLISSETSSAVSDRGEYANDPANGHVTGYDTEKPGWGQTAEGAWGGIGESNGQGILTRDFISGGFTWTGWDYKGEPTPDKWPDINSHFGILDMAGFPKDRFFYYQSVFNTYTDDHAMLHLFPHWNWATSDAVAAASSHLSSCRGMCTQQQQGVTVDVWAFSSAITAELFVNGKSQGIAVRNGLSHLQWPAVPYTAGEIKAQAYAADNKTVIATQTIQTTGTPAQLRATIKDGMGNSSWFGHEGSLVAGCQDVALIMVEVLDSQGRVVPNTNNNITFSHTGPAVYLGGGNGDPSCHTPDLSSTRPAYHGLALGVYEATTVGSVQVTVSSPGLKNSSVKLDVKAATFHSQWWCLNLPAL